MKINQIERFLGSGFYTGYIKVASGTFASFAALLIYLIPGFESPLIIIPIILIFILIGVPISTKFEKIYGKDPSECTIDEIIGMWISLLFLPKNIWLIIITFFIWRAFDILKIYPANKIEEIEGGLGIVFDDVVLALYSLVVMHIINYFFF